MLQAQIIRCSFKQAHFDTPTIGHFLVAAADGPSAIATVREQFAGYDVLVEFVATAPESVAPCRAVENALSFSSIPSL